MLGQNLERAWIDRADHLLGKAVRRTRLLGSLTPMNAVEERARLAAALVRGESMRPAWTYAPAGDHEELVATLERAATQIATDGESPLAAIYAARARELALEARLSMAAGGAEVAELAKRRFAPADPAAVHEGRALARAWIELEPEAQGPLLASDAPEPGSLFSRMQAEIGRLRLPFVVTLQPSLASLAATGERTILIAAGRLLTEEDAVRTVLHEVHGHARPRARATMLRPQIFGIGTARGADDQEGFALVLEERHGFLGARRRRVLAARHLIVEAMHEGATFTDAARRLLNDFGFRPADAIIVAERAFRGGNGERPGLGRERIYLESFARVRAHLARRPDDEHVISAGQVALDAIEALAPFAEPGER